jgi:hypothetical protein
MNIHSLLEIAQINIRDTVTLALNHTSQQKAIIVFDEESELSQLLTEAYRGILPEAQTWDFNRSSSEEILDSMDALTPGDLVVLLQSSSFRFSKFRIRIELFDRCLKVIEHPHLARIGEGELATYIEALAYDPAYYREVGPRLGERIARASQVKIITDNAELIYESTFEGPKLNIGHYEGMKNVGGQFPIGEIFTEPRDVTRVNGTVKLFAFGNTDFSVNFPNNPFIAKIERGLLVSSPDAPKAFHTVLDEIRSKEEVVWVRELGFGLNRALTREKHVTDIGTYERMCGLHFSLGTKHLQYKKPGFPRKQGFHVDVFVDSPRVEIDGWVVFQNGCYKV